MEKHVYVTKDTIFYNSQCLFVEYHDVIKMPMFVLLVALKDNDNIENIFDTTEIKMLDTPSLFEWYINRRHINFFKDLPIRIPVEKIPEGFHDDLLRNYLHATDEFFTINSELSFADVIRLAVAQEKLIKRVVIYDKDDNPFIRSDITRLYGKKAEFVCGDFRSVIAKIPNDSTFVFSDINKINILAETGKLKCASVLIPNGYRYNMIDKDNYKVDFGKLSKEYVFKYDFFDITRLN
jgi:hypothetical protein